MFPRGLIGWEVQFSTYIGVLGMRQDHSDHLPSDPSRMDPLPYDLLKAIVDRVSRGSDQLRIRLSNRDLCALATPHAFQHVRIRNTLASAMRFSEILRHGYLAKYIEAIAFQEFPAIDLGSKEEGRMLDSLASLFSQLHKLPVLRALSLWFDPQHHLPAAHLQCAILAAITGPTRPPFLTSLTILHLAPIPNPTYTSPSFQNLVDSLDSLRITIGPNRNRISQSPFKTFWERTMQYQVLNQLSSLSQSLTLLSLQSSEDVGVIPRVDFSRLNLPSLAHLSLEGILFNDDTQVEDFIVRHKCTLKALHLKECKMAVDEEELPPHPWREIWIRFADELDALVDLEVVQCVSACSLRAHRVPRYKPRYYTRLDVFMEHHSYRVVHTLMPGEEGDSEALLGLESLVARRRAFLGMPP